MFSRRQTVPSDAQALIEGGLAPAIREDGAVALAIEDRRRGGGNPGHPTAGARQIHAQGEALVERARRNLEGALPPVEADLQELERHLIPTAKAAVVELDQVVEEAKDDRERARGFIRGLGAALGKVDLARRRLQKLPYRLLMAGFFIGGVPLTAPAIRVFGDDDRVVWLVAAVVEGAVLWLCHAAGRELREAEEHRGDEQARRHAQIALGVLAAVVGLLAVVTLVRASYLEVQGFEINPWLLLVLQVGIAVAATSAAYAHANSYADTIDDADANLDAAQDAAQESHDVLNGYEAQRGERKAAKCDIYVRQVTLGLVAIRYTYFLYTVYDEAYQTVAEGTAQLVFPAMRIPRWMYEARDWINRQSNIDRPSFVIDEFGPGELPPAA